MRYFALVSDYDGTLTDGANISEPVLRDLGRLRDSGRKLILLTGREFPELLSILPQIALFDRVVAENGAFLYRPALHEEKNLSAPPPEVFFQELRKRGVQPLSRGRVIVSTRHPQEAVVLEVIRQLGLELTLSFNKGAVMILPSGINKSTGLVAALTELGLSPHNAVGVGDAENDHAFLNQCECSVAVANALPVVKEEADIVTSERSGEGVREIIRRMVENDLSDQEDPERHRLLLGTRTEGEKVWVSPYRSSLLVSGSRDSAKPKVIKGFLSQLAELGYQFCMIDPEGDYADVAAAVTLGESHREPHLSEVMQVLEDSKQNTLLTLKSLPIGNRPAFFAALIARLLELRSKTGRPHWIIVNEAHRLLPLSTGPATTILPRSVHGLLLVTGHPDQIFPGILSSLTATYHVGDSGLL